MTDLPSHDTQPDLRILSAGAAKGLVEAVAPLFLAQTGIGIQGTFNAVGAIKEKLLLGESCEVLVLTRMLLDALATDGQVVSDTCAPLGRVRTGIAVREGADAPDIADRDALRATLLAAQGIYLPDPERATAGMHFANVLRRLEIYEEVAPRLRPFPNGATAMRELAQSEETGLIGCTQITEIKYTRGVVLVGPLPEEFGLATVYSVAVASRAAQPELARRFAALLADEETEELRRAAGFESPLAV